MANVAHRLYVDVDQRRLVQSATSKTAAPTPVFIQGDTVTLVIQLLTQSTTGGLSAPYTVIDVTGLTARVGIGTPTAATGTAAPGIFQNSFTLDETNNTLTGTLYITPATVTTLCGSNTQATSTLEIEIAEGGNYTTVFLGDCTVKAELIEGAAAGPSPVDEYMTKNETLGTFAKLYGSTSITLINPEGTHGVVLRVNTDGDLLTEPFTI